MRECSMHEMWPVSTQSTVLHSQFCSLGSGFAVAHSGVEMALPAAARCSKDLSENVALARIILIACRTISLRCHVR